MGFAPPKDGCFCFPGNPRWPNWLTSMLTNGELQLRAWVWLAGSPGGRCSWLERGPGVECGLSGSGVREMWYGQLVWGSCWQGVGDWAEMS